MLLLGPLFIALSFALMLLQVEPFATFFYLFAWYGLVFTWDQLIRAREGRSLVARCGAGGCALILFWSAAGWLFFELINFRLENWYYIFVTDQPWLRLVATFLAFATVFPGIFWIEHYLALRGVAANARWRPLRFSPRGLYLLQALGVLSLVLPLVWPVYFFPLVWGATILLAAPHNYRLGLDGYLRQLERGDYGQTLRLLLAGLIAGLFWEFFNFWARAKWIYTVPFFDELKLFEMPLAGFIGFAPFAVECACIYRLLVWHRLAPAFGEFTQQSPAQGSRGGKVLPFVIGGAFSLAVFLGVESWTVASTTPRWSRVESLDSGTKEELDRIGITYLTQLRGPGSADRWQTLSESLESAQVQRLGQLVGLYLHQGIGTEHGNALVRAGVKSVQDLTRYSTSELSQRLAAVMNSDRLPTPAQLRVWQRRAAAEIED